MRVPEALDERADDLTDAHDAEQVLALEHGQVADLALAHQPRSVEDVVVGRERHELAGHHVADADIAEVGPLPGQAEYVALGEDPNEPVALANADRADVL